MISWRFLKLTGRSDNRIPYRRCLRSINQKMKQMLKTQWLLVAGLVTAPGWTALGQEISTDYSPYD